MNSRKKIINELRCQIDSKEVTDQHYSVQLSASDANIILALLKEQNVCENCAIAIEDRQLIIRCKECKHHYNVIRCRCGGFTPDDWFCAGGKRRTDDD